ncbi:MAG: hypothetical protein BGN96_06705 [Bacteroidales bacterium 45-6]|nr:MAG: hypothetical protein BGN96_06705 [Bacteroidales bacterium 45-6]
MMKLNPDREDKLGKLDDKHEDDLEFALQALNHLEIASSEKFQQWVDESDSHQALYAECLFYREAGLAAEGAGLPDVEQEWMKFDPSPEQTPTSRKRSLPTWVWTAAAAIFAVALLFPWLLHRNEEMRLAKLMEKHVVLQTENGEPIVVDQANKGQIESLGAQTHQSGRYGVLNMRQSASKVKLMSASTSNTYTLNIPKGKAYQLLLEDGTEVYMNTGSKIIFPNHFKSDSRVVEIEGEAYFKVTKDPNRPFIVKTASFSTKVLGTEFNIRAYPQGESNVTLVTGKVLVTSGENEANQVTLSPGQNATCAGGQLLVKDVDVENYIAWKDGYFFFEEASLEDIMNEISRWYNVRVEYGNENLRKLKFKFWANRESSFQDAVVLLNQVGKVDVRMVSPGQALVMPAK